MEGKTQELLSTVREAEAESERVRREKANIMQQWTNTVINVAKRDQVGGKSFYNRSQICDQMLFPGHFSIFRGTDIAGARIQGPRSQNKGREMSLEYYCH